tara:strand:+ start:1339 stop:1698 length:360 start_codon:yes stop_codon:yes gene_type:complete
VFQGFIEKPPIKFHKIRLAVLHIVRFSSNYYIMGEVKKYKIPLKTDDDISSDNFLDIADHAQLKDILFQSEELQEYGDLGLKLAGAMASVILAQKYLQIVTSELLEEIPIFDYGNETVH